MSAPVIAVLLTATAAIALPHRLPLHRATPATSAAVLAAALLVRALVMVAIAMLALQRLSNVGIVQRALDWCWHELLPDLPTALGFAEHPVTHAAVAAPLGLLGMSVAWLVIGQFRAWHELRQRLAGPVSEGPAGTTIVADDRLLFAVTRLGRRRILVSDTALGELDERELVAGITHELGHLRRGHRSVLEAAALLGALARPMPGTRATKRALRFQLERDADAFAVRELHDPLSLASAICKVAGANRSGTALVTLSGSGPVVLRVRELLDGGCVRSQAAEFLARAALAGLIALIAALAATSPGWASAPVDHRHEPPGHACHHR
jgi:Zn-dependent protease with chaperone function